MSSKSSITHTAKNNEHDKFDKHIRSLYRQIDLFSIFSRFKSIVLKSNLSVFFVIYSDQNKKKSNRMTILFIKILKYRISRDFFQYPLIVFYVCLLLLFLNNEKNHSNLRSYQDFVVHFSKIL